MNIQDLLDDHPVVADDKHWRRRHCWRFELDGDGWVTVSDHRTQAEVTVPVVDLWNAASHILHIEGKRLAK